MATATASLGNVGSTPHSSADLRVGTAVALASSVAKYWVLNLHGLLPGTLPQVSVYHSHHNSSHRSGGGGEASSSKESASSLNQEMALTSSSHHQQQSTAAQHHHHQPSVSSSSHHSSLQSNPQVCYCVVARVLCNTTSKFGCGLFGFSSSDYNYAFAAQLRAIFYGNACE